VYGLAFAGILTDLGIDGSQSVLALLAFNVGVELAQLTATALLFPSLYLIARTRYYPAFRCVGAAVALVAAVGWVSERLAIMASPLSVVEDAAIDHPWWVVAGVGAPACFFWVVDGRLHKASDGVRVHRNGEPAGVV
jgi:hypothetical protein